MFFCVTYSSFDILGSVAVKTKAVFPSIITNAFGLNLICSSLVPWLFTSILCYCFNFSKSSEMMNFHFAMILSRQMRFFLSGDLDHVWKCNMFQVFSAFLAGGWNI